MMIVTMSVGWKVKENSHLKPSSSILGLRQHHFCQPGDTWSKCLGYLLAKIKHVSGETQHSQDATGSGGSHREYNIENH